MTTNIQKEIPHWLNILVTFSIVVAISLLMLFFWKFHGGLSDGLDKWGQFGDYLGGILNPLFSLTALFALLYTIKLQSKELHESTEQLKASAEAFKLQNNVLIQQQFENKFFQMLGVFTNIVETLETELRVNDELKTIKGRNCFIELSPFLWQKLEENVTNEMSNLSSKYREFYKWNEHFLDRYYLSLNLVICFVDYSKLLEEEKKFYCSIIRTQFSAHELAFLFYHCLCMDGEWQELSTMVKKYDMLKYLSNKYMAKSEHRDLF